MSAMSREHSYIDHDDDGIFAFIAGILLGLMGGAIVGLLLAPKSGNEFRTGTYKALKELPSRVNDEFTRDGTRTRDLIDKTRYNIENQVGKVRNDRKADRMAKAKRAEELASGYEFN